MSLQGVLKAIQSEPLYRAGLEQLQSTGPGSTTQLGLIRAAQPVMLAGLATDVEVPLLVISDRSDHAHTLGEQMLAWNPDLTVLRFDEPGVMFYEYAAWTPTSQHSRIKVLTELSREAPGNLVVITSAAALMQRTLPRDVFVNHRITLQSGTRLPAPVDTLLYNLLNMGYQGASVVTLPGTFSRRGGIIDVYPVHAERPVRIELWGDDIDSLREFEPGTQRSTEEIAEVLIPPAREALPIHGPVVAKALKRWFSEHHSDDGDPRSAEYKQLTDSASFPELETYLPWMVDNEASLLDYLPTDALVVIDDYPALEDRVVDLERQAIERRENAIAHHTFPADMPRPFISWAHIYDSISQHILCELGGHPEGHVPGSLFQPGPRFSGQLRMALDEIASQVPVPSSHVVIVTRQAGRLAELWNERTYEGVRARPLDALNDLAKTNNPAFVQGTLTDGWKMRGQNTILLYSDSELFGWKRPEPRRRPQRTTAAPESFFSDMAIGDTVVHSEFGISRFEGLAKRTLNGTEREYLLLSYAGGDYLYVPIHQADRLSRYVGVDNYEPELSRLGTQDWGRVRQRTRAAVEDVAQELLDLYAQRATVVGHAFNLDTPWQNELEASFTYTETQDQLRALTDVKRDMQKPQPMDRLICGDVGYGKTEVALRAAFKAVMDGKQVALLVPTTVLAQQHLETFSHRLAPFPVKVEMLSRFRSASEQAEIINAFSTGELDILIGTHRLLGSDVKPKDLGLLIIDEEQRFGVAHKEQLKQMRTEVDVLTLTATPIPRTLYMGLTGVRDISIINTAPAERLPVVTHVARREEFLIRQAIIKELDRGGQVFFVHNRVRTIQSEVARLRKLVPEARIGMAHGQMNEHQLEKIMQAFGEQEIDVLVSTNIIEAGLDIPNANTLIVDRADRFGLSQLYQLRGRVGRSANRAYAYFFHPPANKLTDEARMRLDTIAEYTDLGSGMNIAMRDLEIRGAGDLLGTRQSGHIAAVGFHLYMRMLSQTVQQLKELHEAGIQPEQIEIESLEGPREFVTIELPIATYIPMGYIPDMGLRIQLYRRIGDLSNPEAVEHLEAELTDRFGPLPDPVKNLLYQIRVKLLALQNGADAIITENEQVGVKMAGLAFVDRQGLQRQIGMGVRVSRTALWLSRSDNWQQQLLTLLERLPEFKIASQQKQTEAE